MAALSLRGALLRPAPMVTASMSGAPMSSDVRVRGQLNTAGMKRGRGGRSSFSGDVVTVFGSNGFIGTGIANRSVIPFLSVRRSILGSTFEEACHAQNTERFKIKLREQLKDLKD